jgi:putative peptide zinc metalloprotease protein
MTARVSLPADQLPRLRADVVLADGGVDGTGAHGFVLHDPLRHRFFRLSKGMALLLRDWPKPAASDPEAVTSLAEFLVKMRLAEAPVSAPLVAEREQGERPLFSRLVHSYLSFRVPLVNPEPFLDALLPAARLLASRAVIISIIGFGLLGFYFAGRQWEHFQATFVDFFTPAGALHYGVTLVGLKVFHELGHGFVARHFGCRVPVMGVNFMVLTPMLYTEASEAWRLSSGRQRFLISAAGVLVEMALAAIALLLWAFLPDGPMRSAAYFVAATAWIMSLLVNLSPFMRFDGYHMLADLTGLHGIGPRAFALATWSLRELLFKTGEPMSEFHPPFRRRALVALAVGTWIYRLGLFSGLALLVYHMFPKLLGLPLAAIEIHWFIVKPIIRELKDWKAMGLSRLFVTGRGRLSLTLLVIAVALLALPLDRHVVVPAILVPAEETRLFAPEAGQVLAVHVRGGVRVAAGEVLLEIAVPEIAHRRGQTELRLAMTEIQLARLAADADDRAQRQVIERERQSAVEELEGLQQRQARLVLRAPFSGVVSFGEEALMAGQWVGTDRMLLHLRAPDAAVIAGLVPELSSGRLKAGAVARFVSEAGTGPAIEARLRAIGHPGGEGQALNYLSSPHGGPVGVAPDLATGRDMPVQGHLPVYLSAATMAPAFVVRGSVVVEAEPESVLGYVFGRVVTVVLRESGF